MTLATLPIAHRGSGVRGDGESVVAMARKWMTGALCIATPLAVSAVAECAGAAGEGIQGQTFAVAAHSPMMVGIVFTRGSLPYLEDSRELSHTGYIETAFVYNTKTWTITHRFRIDDMEDQGGLTPVALSSDGRWLAVSRRDGFIDIYDTLFGRIVHKLLQPRGFPESIALSVGFSPDGSHFVVGCG